MLSFSRYEYSEVLDQVNFGDAIPDDMPTWDELFDALPGVSQDDVLHVDVLAEPFGAHPAGAVLVDDPNHRVMWIQDRPKVGTPSF